MTSTDNPEDRGVNAPAFGSGPRRDPTEFRLGEWWVSPGRGLLTCEAASHHVEPKVMDVLVYLGANGGRVVSKDELLDALWPGAFIQEGALFRHVSELRRLLGDDARNPRYIETIPKRGYRLIAQVVPDGREAQRVEGQAGTAAEDPVSRQRTEGWFRHRALLWALAALLLTIGAVLPWPGRSPGSSSVPRLPPGPPPPSRSEVAVLPFQDLTRNPELEYLRTAVADEIATALAREPTLRVRPAALTRRYPDGEEDPRAIGTAVHAGTIIAGQYALEGGRLAVTIEAIDAADNQVFWRQRVAIDASDLISLRALVSERVQSGLLPALDVPAAADPGPAPNDPRAYELYLKSLGAGYDVALNASAIADLERAVELDPGFAPAWAALAERLYFESAYGANLDSLAQRALAAARRAEQLDPDLVVPGLLRAVLLTEGGLLGEAFDVAHERVVQQVHKAESHLALSYVYRYAGVLEEAAGECEIALALSPANYRLRSCAIVMLRLEKYERALDFIALARGSDWELRHRGLVALQRGWTETARRVWHRLPEGSWLHGVLDACLDRPADPETVRIFSRLERVTVRDPEAWYVTALVAAACGRRESALSLLEAAIGRNYCALSALESEPAFAGLRSLEGWQEVRDSAAVCRDSFLAYRAERGIP